jgi:tetratricopeptide (TPR) repeat protein
MKTRTRNILLITSIAGVLLVVGCYFGYRLYKSARQARLIAQARTYLAKPDERKAFLCLQRALRYNPKDADACRLMAELAERGRSPSALIWRNRVVELKPTSLDDRLALAQTAMLLRDLASATNALEGVDAAGRKTAGYHNIAGTVAAAIGQPAHAEAHFLEVIRLEPQNAAPQLNLAIVRLLSTNATVLAEARISLRRISSNPTNSSLRCQALRELAADALRHKQSDTALALTKQLLTETNSVFADRLMRLDALKECRSPEFDSTLAAFQREAASNPANISELAVWQMAKTSPAQTLTWLRALPQTAQTDQAVILATADCYSVLQDWRGLQAAVEHQNWGELEFFRHAFKARALRGQDLAGAAKGEWELAVKSAQNQRGSLIMLLRVAVQWRWQPEIEELLWAIVSRYPDERWAVPTLAQTLFLAGQTRPLMALFTQQVKRVPSDLDAKNNLAITALLLEAKEINAHELAREIYQKVPTNSSYASTYAFSLHLQKKDAEALKVMEQLKPKDLEKPSIAGYYGLILRATGNAEKARAYLGWASKARVLPEEQKLFDRARAGA